MSKQTNYVGKLTKFFSKGAYFLFKNRWISKGLLFFKGPIYGRKFQLKEIFESPALNDFTLTVARSEANLKSAFALVYESYSRINLISHHKKPYHFSKFHLLPTTLVVIMKHKQTNEVVATMSVINDSPLGLPMDEAEDLSEIRKMGRVVEFGAFTIKQTCQKLKGQIYLPIWQYAYSVAREAFRSEYAVCMTHPKAIDFYRLMGGCCSVSGNIFSYSKAKGAPAISMVGPCSIVGLKKISNSLLTPKFTKKMTKLLASPSSIGEPFSLGKSHFFSDYSMVLSTQTLNTLFNLFKDISEYPNFAEMVQLRNLYFGKRKSAIFDTGNILLHSQRVESRLLTKCNGLALLGENSHKIYTKDVSVSGLSFITEKEFCPGDKISLILHVGKTTKVLLDTEIRWKRSNHHYGVSIVNVHTKNWYKFVTYLGGLIDSNGVQEKKFKALQ